jgi:hypothetical protein
VGTGMPGLNVRRRSVASCATVVLSGCLNADVNKCDGGQRGGLRRDGVAKVSANEGHEHRAALEARVDGDREHRLHRPHARFLVLVHGRGCGRGHEPEHVRAGSPELTRETDREALEGCQLERADRAPLRRRQRQAETRFYCSTLGDAVNVRVVLRAIFRGRQCMHVRRATGEGRTFRAELRNARTPASAGCSPSRTFPSRTPRPCPRRCWAREAVQGIRHYTASEEHVRFWMSALMSAWR